MATPNPMGGSPGSVNLDQATLGRLGHTGDKTGVKSLFAQVAYSGSWAVSASVDNNEIVTGNLAWSTNKLTIAVSGFTVAPSVVVSGAGSGSYGVAATATSATNIDVWFFNRATGALVTTEDSNMIFNIHVEGS